MTHNVVGRHRSNAGKRIIVALLLVVTVWLWVPLLVIVGAIYMVGDVLPRLVLNRGRQPGSVMGRLRWVWDWFAKLLKWVVYNRDR